MRSHLASRTGTSISPTKVILRFPTRGQQPGIAATGYSTMSTTPKCPWMSAQATKDKVALSTSHASAISVVPSIVNVSSNLSSHVNIQEISLDPIGRGSFKSGCRIHKKDSSSFLSLFGSLVIWVGDNPRKPTIRSRTMMDNLASFLGHFSKSSYLFLGRKR